MEQFVLRVDQSHDKGAAQRLGGPHASLAESGGLDRRVADFVGGGGRVLILGQDTDELARMLRERGARPVAVEVEGIRSILNLDRDEGVAGDASEWLEGDARCFDVVVLADLVGRLDDPGETLRVLRPQIRPGGALLLTIIGLAPVAGHPEILGKGLPGAGTCRLFTYDGLIDLLEGAEYAVGHLERVGPMAGLPDTPEHPAAHDGLIVAHPLPFPGLDSLQRRLRALALRERDAAHEAEALRQHLEQAGRRLEILVGREQALAERVRDLRAQLLAAHARMIERDTEIHKTFGDLAAERDALARSLRAVEARLNLFRKSAVGHVYRAARKAIARVRAGRESSGREGGAD
ncbi:MAG: hypothetical protein JO116_17260 [Planctomycetaceae bacterium]|nr:hypothetical protein [Planctomycetaceae bacterium]